MNCQYLKEKGGKYFCSHEKFYNHGKNPLPEIPIQLCQMCTIKDIPCTPKELDLSSIPDLPQKKSLPKKFPPTQNLDVKVSPSEVKRLEAPKQGPGTKLQAIFKILAPHVLTCGGCRATLNWMNELGPQGCKENIEEILRQINKNKKSANLDWKTKISAAKIALREGLPLTLKGLVLRAIEEAEQELQSNQQPPSDGS